VALKPLKPSKAKRSNSKHPPSLEQRAQEWVSQWRLEEQRRRKVEESMGSVSWRQDSALDFNQLEPSLRQRVLQLLA
jgi:hypothetical protein